MDFNKELVLGFCFFIVGVFVTIFYTLFHPIFLIVLVSSYFMSALFFWISQLPMSLDNFPNGAEFNITNQTKCDV